MDKCWFQKFTGVENVEQNQRSSNSSQGGDALESVDVLLGEAGQVSLGVGTRRHWAVDEPVLVSSVKKCQAKEVLKSSKTCACVKQKKF